MQTVAVDSSVQVPPPEVSPARSPLIDEDWLAVLVAGVLIALVLAGVRPSNPAGTALQVLVPLAIGAAALRARLVRFLPGVLVLAGLSWLAQAASELPAVAAWGLEYVIVALAIGLIVNHAIAIPDWIREAVRTEYYIKIGLVVLGASILFGDIARAGLLGMCQALVVVLSVWTFAFWLARRLRVDDEFATMLSSAVAICGVSAAIATCGAIQGDRRKLSYVTSPGSGRSQPHSAWRPAGRRIAVIGRPHTVCRSRRGSPVTKGNVSRLVRPSLARSRGRAHETHAVCRDLRALRGRTPSAAPCAPWPNARCSRRAHPASARSASHHEEQQRPIDVAGVAPQQARSLVGRAADLSIVHRRRFLRRRLGGVGDRGPGAGGGWQQPQNPIRMAQASGDIE